MSKVNLSNAIQSIRKSVVKHSPEILTGIGIAGMITTTVLAVKATPKATFLIEARAVELGLEHSETPPPAEIIRAAWKCYIPAIVTGTVSIICLVGASSTNLKRNAALATAYKLSETALSEYRDAVVETIGEKKEKVVRDRVIEDRMKNDPVTNKEVIITEKGNTLCYDSISGRYFKSDMDHINSAKNEINEQLLKEMYVSLNDFYYRLGLDDTSIGDKLGWALDDGLIDLHLTSKLASDGTPCLAIDYELAPKYGYYNFN